VRSLFLPDGSRLQDGRVPRHISIGAALQGSGESVSLFGKTYT